MPPPRPAGLSSSPQPAPPQQQPAAETTPPPPAPDPACARILGGGKLVVKTAPAVTGPDGCGIPEPARLEAIILTDGSHVPMEPPSLTTCGLAEALGDWVRDDIAPLAAKAGGTLTKVLGSDGYECRSRNHVEGAKLSEHGKGTALDVRGFALRDGTQLLIDHETDARDFMAELKTAACARFMTVLGPGSDGYHESHLHVDLAERHNNYRICEWELK